MSITHLLTRTKNVNGFTLIELIVTISLVAVLATVALDKLIWYQGQAEKANMEFTASIIKSGLLMSAANLMMANKGAEIPTLASKNPIDFLAEKPINYLGEIDGGETEILKGGNWYFDRSQHQVVYVVGQRHNFTPAITDDFVIRYGIKLIYSEIEIIKDKKINYVAGITLVPLSHYKWQ